MFAYICVFLRAHTHARVCTYVYVYMRTRKKSLNKHVFAAAKCGQPNKRPPQII